MNRLSLLSLVFVLSACDGQATSQTFLSPTPAVTYTLSGVVSEMTPTGPVPIQGAVVVQRNAVSTQAVTDANGRYILTGLSTSSYTVSISMDGFMIETKGVTMTGDTQLDIRLERMASYILSGMVFEMTETGPVPVERVEIYCDSCGSPYGHTFVYTDANGLYSLAWAFDGVHPLFVTKAGYEIFDPTGKLLDRSGRINATVKGDTRFDVRLVRR
jgi:Carboxypeptidase regulatory-like domain